MTRRTLITSGLLCIFLAACASSKVSTQALNSVIATPQTVKSIAMAPGGAVLSEAVAIELANKGFTVIDSDSTTKLVARLGITEVELATPSGMSKLKSQGIDAFLAVKGLAANDGRPISCSARLNSTSDGKLIAGVSWQNGWGGGAGSIADRTMRKGLTEAAAEITEALAKTISPI